jgi:hypothetical protein
MQVVEVPDPVIEQPTDVLVEITSTGLCGSDLHLYDPLTPFMTAGDVVGHEPMGIVREVGSAVQTLRAGDRVVVPFNISCGSCWMCDRGLFSQCETTQNRDSGTGASLFGYSKLYGQVPGGQVTPSRSRSRTARPTTASSSSPTCCRPRGRRWSTPTSRTAAPCSSSAPGRSATWPPGSGCTAA